MGFMKLVQVHPLLRHGAWIQTHTYCILNTVLFSLQNTDFSMGSLRINEMIRHSELQEGYQILLNICCFKVGITLIYKQMPALLLKDMWHFSVLPKMILKPSHDI